jgi:ethanolamine permease
VGDWTALSNINDPLPRAMKAVVGENSGWLHMLVWIGLFGLVASFHGIIMGYSRQIFALARAGFLPPVLAAVHPKLRTPYLAILAGGVIGIAAIYSDNLIVIAGQTLTANIVTISVFGAIVMYIMSMASLFRLRRTAPTLERPFRAPLYPVFPAIALGLAILCLVTMIYYNLVLFSLFLALFVLAFVYYRATSTLRASANADALLETAQAEARVAAG